MKVKLEQLVMASEPLQVLFNERLPIATTFRLKKIVKVIDENLTTFQETRAALLEKYGEDPENTGSYTIPEKNQEVVDKEYKELLQTEVSLGIEPLHVSLFEGVRLSPKELVLLEWMITE